MKQEHQNIKILQYMISPVFSRIKNEDRWFAFSFYGRVSTHNGESDRSGNTAMQHVFNNSDI
ncbi:hypothetical protein [Leptospira noguchii]|nr:hypothetical protein [Leptospira noguchii]UOG32634.1 hypothetical protein MAL06_20405 [Leptospira noguchii]